MRRDLGEMLWHTGRLMQRIALALLLTSSMRAASPASPGVLLFCGIVALLVHDDMRRSG